MSLGSPLSPNNLLQQSSQTPPVFVLVFVLVFVFALALVFVFAFPLSLLLFLLLSPLELPYN
jgi:hypothetical protein